MAHSAEKDLKVFTFHSMIAPFLKVKGETQQENIVDKLLVRFVKEDAAEGGASKRKTYTIETVEKVKQEVKEAIKNKTLLRVAGSCHSVDDAIFPENGKTLVLKGDLRKIDKVEEVEEDGKKYLYCRIGAGCNLGKDPVDKSSTWENSVCYYISERGYCFPILGGIIHQTVGGFMQTGSAGGSLKHGISDVIREIEFVDGKGELRIARPNTDLWYAVGVSMGMLGIITHVTFRFPEAKLIKGNETGYKFADPPLRPDEIGKSKLIKNLKQHEYYRINWLPQKEVNRVQEWSGKQVASCEEIVPYRNVLSIELAAGMAAIILSIYDYILNMDDPDEGLFEVVGNGLKQFIPITTTPFCDAFYNALPMDDKVPVDSIMRVDLTEIWIPIEYCQTVMDKLSNLFENNRKAAGNFATEIYAAKESPFWLSMSYGGPMVRVDPYWWSNNRGDCREYFTFFWDALLEIPGARLHWGKYLPSPNQECGSVIFNSKYLMKVYPRLNDWLVMRDTMDPHQIFVTDYWREILDIPPLLRLSVSDGKIAYAGCTVHEGKPSVCRTT